ncbi:hypothetical protein GQX73_g3428 [Xylaria multiplex]|uniref:DUF1776-domain-containing protein n=1 Tax=Xylaria multiplex TaxID=323545 RepID=A0A7C8IR05_9PEZI|nr:hypothetical protein GQX73_g3428 [Xylaria multiplex]
MSADDQQFWDLLSSVPNHVRQYSGGVADFLDRTVEKAAENVRDTLASTSWIPDYARPKSPSLPPVQTVPLSTWERMQNWVVQHKLASGVFVCVVGYVTYRTVRHSRLVRKSRRARRAKNGSRLEVVVIAGSPSLPLTKSLSLDLERRGFIVYIVCNTIEDEMMVQHAGRPDIRGLSIDITDPLSVAASIDRFAAYLQTPHAAPPSPPSNFADLFKTHLLQPILTIQAFLPLLTSRLTPPPPPQTNEGEKSEVMVVPTPKVLVFTPSIISSINPPFHAPEATVCSALSAFTEVLTAELHPLRIPVTHLQLGTFDFTGFVPARGPHNPGLLPRTAETQQWPEAARLAYARNYESQSSSAISAGRIRGLRGSALRDLHNAVFDVLDGSNQADVVRVGLGAGLYGFVGRWAPRGLVSWMMGIRKVDQLSTWERSYSGSGSEKSSSEDSAEAPEYISVGRGYEGGAK